MELQLENGEGLSRLLYPFDDMADEEIRFWPRVGMYVTQEFAEEWITRITDSDSAGGRYLDDDMEEYTTVTVTGPSSLRREIKALFEAPFEEGKLSPDVQAIMVAEEMQRNKKNRIVELKKEGLTLEDAKLQYEKEIDERICEILGVKPGSMSVGMGIKDEESEESEGVDEQSEASVDDENTD